MRTFDVQGVVSFGNYTNDLEVRERRIVNLVGSTVFDGGNLEFADFRPNGYTLVLLKKAPGHSIDGVKQDDYTRVVTEPFNKITQFKTVLYSKKAGEDAWDAWVWIVDYCQANPTADRTAFLTAFDVMEFTTYQGFIVKSIEAIFGLAGFESIRDAINTQSRDRLIGENTELVRVVT